MSRFIKFTLLIVLLFISTTAWAGEAVDAACAYSHSDGINNVVVVEIVALLFLLVTLCVQLSDKNRTVAGRWLLAVSILCVFMLSSDILAYLTAVSSCPLPIAYGINFLAYTMGCASVFAHVGFCYFYVRELTPLGKWAFRVPAALTVVCFLGIAIKFLSGEIVAPVEGHLKIVGGVPGWAAILMMLILIYRPVLSIVKRDVVRLCDVMLFSLYAAFPIVAILVAVIFKNDYSYAVGTFMVVAVVAQYNSHMEEIRTRELNEKLLESSIRSSINQMQPHFLYNALASIREIILDDPQYASDLVYDFTTHLRACIKSMDFKVPIPFEQELTNIRAYVNIEKMRFGDRLTIIYDLGVTDFKVVALGIQPVVENAIKHGACKRSDGGMVTVKTFADGDYNVVQVIDNGPGFDFVQVMSEIESGKRDSKGMKNFIFRFEKMMNAKIDFDSKIGEGTTVTIRLPK